MKKLILFAVIFMSISGFAMAINNLDFRLDTPEKGFYPNEKIPLNVSLINRDTSFTSKNISLTITIGERAYSYDVGDLKPSEVYQKQITLPKFPAGTHIIKGEANYTGILDEQFTELSYGSFEILFPPIERYPRNVYVSNYELPDKIITGKTYDVSITITNDGDVDADLFIEFGSVDEFFTETTTLDSQESTTVRMNVNFKNSGVSLIEARAYAVIDGEKYLLNYRGKKTFVQEEKIANLSFDRIEYIDETDNAINQEDKVKFKIYIENSGDTATNVNTELISTRDKLSILKSNMSYIAILGKSSFAPSSDYFEIETKDSELGNQELILRITYFDSETRVKEVKIPIEVIKGLDSCTADNECSDKQKCENKKCTDILCNCGYIKDRTCIKYSCCQDSDCGEYNMCNQEIHQCVRQTGCLKVLYTGNSNDKVDILIIGAEYNSPAELKNAINKLFSLESNNKYIGFFDVEPFKSNKNKFNIWMIPAQEYTTKEVGVCGQSCSQLVDFEKDTAYIAQCPNVDTTITIFKTAKFRSCAGGGQWSSLSCQDEEDQGKLILHESGHSFGRLADEYTEPSKGSHPWGPNCAASKNEAMQKWGDLAGQGDIGYFQGCSYTDNNIRPNQNSLMRSHYSATSYGLVNERAILKILEKYK